MFAYCNNNPINFGDAFGNQPMRKNTVFINDGAGGDIGPIGITNSYYAIKWNTRSKTAPIKDLIKVVDEFKSSKSGEAILAINQIRAGGSNISKGFGLILTPDPIISDDLLGVGLITYGVLQSAGGITKAIIWMVGK